LWKFERKGERRVKKVGKVLPLDTLSSWRQQTIGRSEGALTLVRRPNENGRLLEEIPGDGIIPIACDGALIEHNVMRDCTRLLEPSDADAGIWPFACDNTVIQLDEVSDHKAPRDADT
jgi:hypothetical protein